MKPMSSEVRDEDDALRARFLAPGDVLHLDYRSAARRATAYSPASGHEARPLRILTWNVERGIKAAEIIADLRRADADIVCLQEIDSGCDRSSGVDIGVAVAKALGLNYLFQLEFVELNSAAGQTLHGVHGNGILSKFDFSEAHSIDHRCQVRIMEPSHSE
jgi:endonuclease/exonuclease/phosphatase family metal-dependent hydrolase